MNRFLKLAIVGAVFLIIGLYIRQNPSSLPGPIPQVIEQALVASTPEPEFTSYTAPKLPKKTAYTVVFLGDSMTAALGPYTDRLRETLKKKYPDIDLIIENQSAPSSNVESLQERLLTRATVSGATFDPVLAKPFDIIVIESFGYNPLSYLGLTEGMNKQEESLKTAMRILARERPGSLVIFLATVAPSYTQYGVGSIKLTPQQRREWASERALYIQNHIDFAKEHNIPLVDVYHQTLDASGNGLSKYINPTDHIHPSHEGVIFIQDEISKFLTETKVFE